MIGYILTFCRNIISKVSVSDKNIICGIYPEMSAPHQELQPLQQLPLAIQHQNSPRQPRRKGCKIMVVIVLMASLGIILGVLLFFLLPTKSERPASIPDDHVQLHWWQNGTIYRIFLPSFRDIDEDGVGDYLGIKEKMNYFKHLSVNILWLSPIQDCNSGAYGIDVIHFDQVKERYGYPDDFDVFIQDAKQNKMKVIMDVIITHSSIAHDWFQRSRKKEEPYTDYYIWDDTKSENEGPPDDSTSRYGHSAWKWDDFRQAFYFHSNLDNEPDLNYRSEHVRKEIKDMMHKWLEAGISGFCLKDVSLLYNHPWYSRKSMNDSAANNLDFIGLFNEAVREWQPHRVNDRIVLFEWDGNSHQVGQPYNWINSDLYYMNSSFTGHELSNVIQNLPKQLPIQNSTIWPFRILGDDNRTRIANRFGDLSTGLQIIHLLLPGTPIIYYGEEIQMRNHDDISFNETRDTYALRLGPTKYKKVSRDPFRTPMQWDSSKHSGFSSAKVTWLPVHSNYHNINADLQMNSNGSLLTILQKLNNIRKHSLALIAGEIQFHHVSTNLFSFIRTHRKDPIGYLIIFNLGDSSETTLHLRRNYELLECLQIIPTEGQIKESDCKSGSMTEAKGIDIVSFKNQAD